MTLQPRQPGNPCWNSWRATTVGWCCSAWLCCSLPGWLAVRWANVPAFLLPTPPAVWQKLVSMLSDGSLLSNAWSPSTKCCWGCWPAACLPPCWATPWQNRSLLEKVLSPYLVASQAVPIVAIAPLLVIWFGPGMFSKVLICALIVFFPVLVNTMVGLRAVPDNLRDLMRSLRATRWQTLRHLEIPAALPVLLGGLRIGATLSVIGAVVGEFVGADRGLGFLINVGRGQYDTALVFVAVFTLIVMALALYGLVMLAERRSTRWQTADREVNLLHGGNR